ncbi:hypothetical protein Pogu_0093 [Pyrobaculum oguniense TE7]|uniref:Uncharacterized protein n=1 Tax=Pyrobaculum oguniense (strain DSM 13380 / JCM 10595 / TE7) TaxID=698757 RepID=H6Q6G2_PYROT|nr:hypothetical protein Pogu_0093 [Pyrobaculum oguniense TE7]
MAKRRNYKPLIALIALAAAALVTAALTFTNITYWLINATLPPAMKYAGGDTGITSRDDGSGYNRYVYVSYYYDSDTGYNITRISIVGFTGDPTNYTDVLRVCNRYYDGSLYVKLVAKGPVGSASYVSYVRDFRVYFYNPVPGAGGKEVRFVGSSVDTSDTGYVILYQGDCAQIGAYVLVDPTLPATARDGRTVIAQYEVDVVFTTSP